MLNCKSVDSSNNFFDKLKDYVDISSSKDCFLNAYGIFCLGLCRNNSLNYWWRLLVIMGPWQHQLQIFSGVRHLRNLLQFGGYACQSFSFVSKLTDHAYCAFGSSMFSSCMMLFGLDHIWLLATAWVFYFCILLIIALKELFVI